MMLFCLSVICCFFALSNCVQTDTTDWTKTGALCALTQKSSSKDDSKDERANVSAIYGISTCIRVCKSFPAYTHSVIEVE